VAASTLPTPGSNPARPLTPNAPASACGPGNARVPGSVCAASRSGAIDAPIHHWYDDLPGVTLAHRAMAVLDAVDGCQRFLPRALLDATGMELRDIVAGILPSLVIMVAVLALSTAIGAAAGAALGALAGGVGAIPGAAAGAGLGLEAGTALLEWAGLAFLVATMGRSLVVGTRMAATAVTRAWHSVDQPETMRGASVLHASHELANAVGEVFRGILQGIVAFLLVRGTTAAASRVPELVANLRKSRFGDSFAVWIERNWGALVENPRLRDRPVSRPMDRRGSAATTPSAAAKAADATPSAEAAPASFLKPKLPKNQLEPGAVPGVPDPAINAMPAVPDGFPPIQQDVVNTFDATPTPETLPEGTKLYRVIGDGNNPSGAFWSRDLPDTEADWRAGSAVKGEWNGDGGYVEYTVPEGGMPAWTGQSAAQPAGAPGYVLPGGADQVVVQLPPGASPSAPIPTPWSGP
jgi:hypothetical protein